MNKKGFTLIEMLVVIAVIAVLVSIVIPTVTSATDKAAAATNAANMRSWKAELTTAYLANGKAGFTIDATTGVTTNSNFPAPAVKAMEGIAKTDTMVAKFTNNEFVITIKDYTIADFANFAGGETGTLIKGS